MLCWSGSSRRASAHAERAIGRRWKSAAGNQPLIDLSKPWCNLFDWQEFHLSGDRLTPPAPSTCRARAAGAHGAGYSLKEAGQAPHVSYKTVDKHKVNLMKKLGIYDRVELARFAIREKIV